MKSEIKQRRNRFWAMLLAIVMVVGLMPDLGVKAKDNNFNVGDRNAENNYLIDEYLDAGDTFSNVPGSGNVNITYYDINETGDGTEKSDTVKTYAISGETCAFNDGHAPLSLAGAHVSNRWKRFTSVNKSGSDYNFSVRALPQYSIAWKNNSTNIDVTLNPEPVGDHKTAVSYVENDGDVKFAQKENIQADHSVEIKDGWNLGWKVQGDTTGTIYSNDKSNKINIDNITGFDSSDGNTDYYVTFNLVWYTNVLFYDNYGGVSLDDAPPVPCYTLEDVVYGSKIAKPANKPDARVGYEFVDWYKDGAGTNKWDFTNDTVTTANLNLFAKWKKVYYVKFNTAGGTFTGATADYTYKDGDAALNLATLTGTASKDGYTFDGWMVGTQKITEINSTNAPTLANAADSTITLTASWKQNRTVTYKYKNADGIDATYTYTGPDGTAANLTLPATLPTTAEDALGTYTLVGWREVGGTVTITTAELPAVSKDVTYEAVYTTVNKFYDISFLNEDGTETLKAAASYQAGTAGADIVQPATPQKTATVDKTFVFRGWKDKDTQVEYAPDALPSVLKKSDYCAVFNSNTRKYSVSFVAEDGVTVIKAAQEYDYNTLGSAIDKPADPTKDSTVDKTFTFKGWSDGTNTYASDSLPKVEKNVVYTAVFDSATRKYSVTFVNDDGTSLKAAQNYDYNTLGANIVKPQTPSKESTVDKTFTFKGWSDGTNTYASDALPKVEKDVVYTAVYESAVRKYSVTFSDEGGRILKAAQKYDYNTLGSNIIKPANPVKSSTVDKTYTFKGWSDGTSTYVTGELPNVTKDVVYTAVYDSAVRQYLVSFVDYDGSILKAAVSYDYNTPAANIAVPDNPVRPADADNTYSFAGWNPTIGKVTGDVVYKATYSNVSKYLEDNTGLARYTVTFVDEDGSVLGKGTYPEGTPGSRISLPSNPTKNPDEYGTYKFNGWSPKIVPVTGDATYTATYKIEKYKYYNITFVYDDGKTVVRQKTSYRYMTKAKDIKRPANPIKASDDKYDYSFAGWTPEITDVTEDKVYTATYTESELSNSEADKPDSTFGLLFAHMSKLSKDSITLKWVKLQGATGYDIYGSRCTTAEQEYHYEYIDTVGMKKTKYVVKDLDKRTYYKFYIEAFKEVNGVKVILARSVLMHGNTTGQVYGAADQILVDIPEITLYVGEGVDASLSSYTITATEKNTTTTKKSPDGKKIRLHRPICFESSDTKVATVKKNGKRIDKKAASSLRCTAKIKAKKPGECIIWVYAQDGIYTPVKVYVKKKS